jgi:hypothetical protein
VALRHPPPLKLKGFDEKYCGSDFVNKKHREADEFYLLGYNAV